MPWDPQDAERHNHKAKGAKAAQWSAVANSVLKKTGDDGQAIRIANAAIAKKGLRRGAVKKPGHK